MASLLTLAVMDNFISSKTADTSIANTGTPQFAVNNYVIAMFVGDPAAGIPTFAKTGGSATIDSFTYFSDTTGSDTNGVTITVGIAKVTGTGSLNITATYSSAVAKGFRLFKLTGADGTNPIMDWLPTSFLPSNTHLAAVFDGFEYPGTSTTDWTAGGTSWPLSQSGVNLTVYLSQANTSGTTGTPNASNVSMSHWVGYAAGGLRALTPIDIGTEVYLNGQVRTMARIRLIFKTAYTRPAFKGWGVPM